MGSNVVGVPVIAGRQAVRAALNNAMKSARSAASSVWSTASVPTVRAILRSARSSDLSSAAADLMALMAAVHAAEGVNVSLVVTGVFETSLAWTGMAKAVRPKIPAAIPAPTTNLRIEIIRSLLVGPGRASGMLTALPF